MGKYVCPACGETKSEDMFHIKQHKKLVSGEIKAYRNKRCKKCHSVLMTQQKNERYPHAWIRNRYNVDDVTARIWYAKSQTSCEICGSIWSEGTEKLCIDHDHKTGKLRGILCKHCNHVLGHSRESFTILDAAKDYLIKHKES